MLREIAKNILEDLWEIEPEVLVSLGDKMTSDNDEDIKEGEKWLEEIADQAIAYFDLINYIKIIANKEPNVFKAMLEDYLANEE